MALTKGNSKLGGNIWVWSLRAGPDCPGKSDACYGAGKCYALHGHMSRPSVKAAYEFNSSISRTSYFASWMILELLVHKVNVCRVHVAGDFYDAEYVRKWVQIVKASPQVTFYAYTRSWRILDALKAIQELADLPNMHMWYSVDKTTGWPEHVPARVRLAYMQLDDKDLPQHHVHLVFRAKRRTIVKKIDQAIVCPVENGITDTTCTKCGICWNEPKQASTSLRIPLPMLKVA